MHACTHLLCLALLLLTAGCTGEEELAELLPPVPTAPTADGEEDGEVQVRIGFDLPGEEPLSSDAATRASVVGGTEDNTEYVKTLYMVCFTRDGIYLGYRQATLVDQEGPYTHDGVTCQGRELFEGTVPARTARIHFVGNVNPAKSIPGNDHIGGNENTLVKSALMAVNATDNDRICYWGFHGENSSEAMRDWLRVVVMKYAFIENATGNKVFFKLVNDKYYDKNDQEVDVTSGYEKAYMKNDNNQYLDVNGNVTTNPDNYVQEYMTDYIKREGSIVHLVRDRARIEFGHMFDYYRAQKTTVNIDGENVELDANTADYKILQVDWILANGLDHGYIAPFCQSASADHFKDYYFVDGGVLTLATDRLTAYDKSDGARYTPTEEDMVTIYNSSQNSNPLQCSVSNPLFLFEDENDAENPPKIILRVKYQKHRNQTSTADQVTKYHTLMLLDSSNKPCKIRRNHTYKLDIYGLPWEGLGYMTFNEAVNSVEYANNRTVSINDKVPDVNDGNYLMSISGDTYLLYQDPSLTESTQEVTFTYKALNDAVNTSGITTSNFTAKWKEPFAGESFASPDITVEQVSNDGTTFTGKIKFTLGTVINTALQGGTIELHDINSNLTRFINVYTITQFSFLPSGATAITLERDGTNTRTVSGVSCPTYKMTLKIPGNYPVGLYPIDIYMATTTLNPFKCVKDDGTEDTSIGVVMEGTENGNKVNGETLEGMSYTTSGNAWNYRATGSPWNYWYTYELGMKPTVDNDGVSTEDTRDHTYTIYFDDVRGLRAAGNRASDLGLFLKIKYFGPAVAVTTN